MILLTQIEVAKDLLNKDDATIIGVLLAVIAVLLFAIGMLWREKLKDQAYIRDQDKENMKILETLTMNMNLVGNDVGIIRDTTGNTNTMAKNILEAIKERLKH